LLIVALLVTGTVATGCTGNRATGSTPSGSTPTPHSAMAGMSSAQAAAWEGRPAYTHTTTRTEEAYLYAMQHPMVVQWMPCYCGCGAMGHGNNLDCYFDPTPDGSIKFQEHASYCGVCVDITLRTKQLADAGSTLANIRSAIDTEFGGIGPGTDTARPL
jgi:hypothetical protein